MPVKVDRMCQSDNRSIIWGCRDASYIPGGGYDNIYWRKLAVIVTENVFIGERSVLEKEDTHSTRYQNHISRHHSRG